MKKIQNRNILHFKGFVIGKDLTVPRKTLERLLTDKENMPAYEFQKKYYAGNNNSTKSTASYEKHEKTDDFTSANIKMLKLFHDAIFEYDIVSFLKADPFVKVESHLLQNVDRFGVFVEEKILRKFITEQQSIIYKNINNFMKLVNSYSDYLSNYTESVSSMCYKITTHNMPHKKIREVKHKIDECRKKMDETYKSITNGNTLFV